MPRLANIPDGLYEHYRYEFQAGTVTIGSPCGVNCFFCSEKWNPPGLIKSIDRYLTFDEVCHFADAYLPKALWIGDWNRRIASGEFFSHPRSADILQYLASTGKLFEGTLITTNGMDVSADHRRIMKQVGAVVCLSLPAYDTDVRKRIMGGPSEKHEIAVRAASEFDSLGIPYGVGIVPTRDGLDSGDMRRLVGHVAAANPMDITVYRPGFTEVTPPQFRARLSIPHEELFQFVAQMRAEHGIPIHYAFPAAEVMREQLAFMFSQWPPQFGDQSKLFLCSIPVEDALMRCLDDCGMRDYHVKSVASGLFGGNIDCAGLLTAADYSRAIDEFVSGHEKPDLLIMPWASFPVDRKDLSGNGVYDIREKYGVKVALCKPEWLTKNHNVLNRYRHESRDPLPIQ